MFGNTILGTIFTFAKVPHSEKLRNKISKSCGTNRQKVAEFYRKVIYF